MVKRVTRRMSSSASGASGIKSVQSGSNITVDNTDSKNPIIDAIVPIKSFTEGDNVTITDLGDGDFRLSSFQPLNEPSVQRIANSIVLPAAAANIIISAATLSDITITLPIASNYPLSSNKLFETRIANQSSFDVTIVISDNSDFVNSADKIILKANQKDTILTRAFNFPADSSLPSASGWSLADKTLVTFYARYEGNVDMSDFDSPGQPIAFREGTNTDNNSVFELNSSNETQININCDCTAAISYSAEIDAQQGGPVWNIDTHVSINRNSSVIIPEYSRTRTGNFGGEDAWVSQSFNFKLKKGDILSVNLLNNNCSGEHKSATINLSARV